jgi:hypothetical protein
MITPQCTICVRNINNYDGSFMLVPYKVQKLISDDVEDNVSDVIGSTLNMKWACEIHYPIMYKYRVYTWHQAKMLLGNIHNIKRFY